MLKRNYAIDILIENAESYSEKTRIFALNEAEQAVINDKMVGNIYQTALKRKDIDFDNIPHTKGNVQKFHGYENIVGTLNVLKQLSKKFGIKIDELEVVEDALTNLRANRNTFERSFALDVGFLQMYYNTLVYACIESTSLILSSYVEYVKTINNVDFKLKKGKGIQGNICIENLKKFNKSVKTGEFSKFAKNLLDGNKQNIIGGGAIMTVATIAGIAASIVPVARELIYWAYDSRMKISEYLDQQSKFLEMNKVRLNSSGMSAAQKSGVVAKQGEAINKLEQLSDKIKVNHQLTDKSAGSKLKQDNKQWTINSISDNQDGFMFM